jgi:hypothetical protein
MLKIRITLLDDDEELMSLDSPVCSLEDLSSFDEIESCCDSAISSAIPATEQFLLARAQSLYSLSSGKKKNGTRQVEISSKHGSFSFQLQRYCTNEGISDYFSENDFFQKSLRSNALNSYIYKYAQQLSYHSLSDNLSDTFRTKLTAAGLERIVCKEAERITLMRQSEIFQTDVLELPAIEDGKNIDIYEPLTAENRDITLFYDGIGVKRQTDIRKDNSKTEELKAHKAPITVKVNSDVAVLELPNNQFFTAVAGLSIAGKPTYSTVDLIKHQLKVTYAQSPSPLQLVAITDGASCIRKCLTENISPNIRVILDWYHLKKKVQSLLSMICYGKKEEKLLHIQSVNALLWRGKVDETLTYLSKLEIRNKEKYEELTTYVTKHSTEIIDYKRRQEAGRVIGSGRGEKANDTTIARRQKKKGMAWTEKGSKALAIITITHR